MPPLGYQTTYGEKNLTVPLSWFHDMAEWSKINFLYIPKMKSDVKAVLRGSHAPRELGRYARLIETETGHRLLAAVEQAKIDLTEQMDTTASLTFIEEGLDINITRRTFEDSIVEAASKKYPPPSRTALPPPKCSRTRSN